jgi:hypothetical protein
VRTWQELAVALNDWAESVPTQREREYGPKLVREFLRHLEEVQLASTTPFGESDAAAINGFPLAAARLETVIRQASNQISAERGSLGEEGTLRFFRQRPEFVQHVPHQPGGGTDWPWPSEHYFEWHGRDDQARLIPHGRWIFGAGVSFPVATAPAATQQKWLDKMEALGFEYGRGGGWMFLCRYLTLDELAAAGGLHQQTNTLAGWATESFRLLDAHPPI